MKRFGTTLIVVNGLILMALTMIISTVLLNYSKDIMMANNLDNARDTLVKFTSEIEYLMDVKMKKRSEDLLYNKGLISFLTHEGAMLTVGEGDREQAYLVMTALMARHINTDQTEMGEGTGMIGILNRSGDGFSFYDPYDSQILESVAENNFATEKRNTISPSWYYFEENPFGFSDGGLVLMSVNIRSIYSGKYLGKQVYGMTEAVIVDTFSKYEMSRVGQMALVDGEGNRLMRGTYDQTAATAKETVVLTQAIKGTDSYVQLHLPEAYLFGDLRRIYLSNIPLIALLLILSTAVTILIARVLTKPIEPIIQSMRRAEEGDFGHHVAETGQFEMRQLAQYYNHLLRKLSLHVEREKMLSQKEKTAELDALIAQINPHFLSNTLEGIVGQARVIGDRKIATMAWSLGRLFSLMVNKGRPMLAIRYELEHVAMYIKIQNIRYGGLIDLKVSMDKGLEHLLTLKLILQPIVENAVIHGFLVKEMAPEAKAVVAIEVVAIQGDVRFTVWDNGAGMSEERYRDVQEKLRRSQAEIYTETAAAETSRRGNGIGLINIHQRIRLFYGPGYGLTLSRQEGATKFIVTVPKRYK